MNVKAIIPAGQAEITVNGLHQWDYGQKLEIHSADLPALIEVHFSCSGMESAVVRSCATVNGVAEVAIPDLCLEQTTPIVAWVYEIGETSGVTTKTIILPIIGRTRPQQAPTVPEEISDKYTESIAEINKQIGSLKDGTVEVKKAELSRWADNAGCANQDDEGNYIPDTYARKGELRSGSLVPAKAKEAQSAIYDDQANRIYLTYARKDKLEDGTLVPKQAKLLDSGANLQQTWAAGSKFAPGLISFYVCIPDKSYNLDGYLSAPANFIIELDGIAPKIYSNVADIPTYDEDDELHSYPVRLYFELDPESQTYSINVQWNLGTDYSSPFPTKTQVKYRYISAPYPQG